VAATYSVGINFAAVLGEGDNAKKAAAAAAPAAAAADEAKDDMASLEAEVRFEKLSHGQKEETEKNEMLSTPLSVPSSISHSKIF
jgi:ribosomal protein L12E/L44/L45/RPP1/RPP2